MPDIRNYKEEWKIELQRWNSQQVQNELHYFINYNKHKTLKYRPCVSWFFGYILKLVTAIHFRVYDYDHVCYILYERFTHEFFPKYDETKINMKQEYKEFQKLVLLMPKSFKSFVRSGDYSLKIAKELLDFISDGGFVSLWKEIDKRYPNWLVEEDDESSKKCRENKNEP